MVKPNTLRIIYVMGVVHAEAGFDFKINTNDHPPPHLHVWHQGNLVIISMEPDVCEGKIYGNMKKSEVRRARRIVRRNLELFRKEWKRMHG